MFGDFHCACGRKWPSAYAWIEWEPERNNWTKIPQSCKNPECLRDEDTNKVYPITIRPLLRGLSHSRKQHLTEYCYKCKKLGRDCRSYDPQMNVHDYEQADDEDCPDDVSVRSDDSDTSSVVDESDDIGNEQTPVPSDEETTDDRLNRYLQNLDIN